MTGRPRSASDEAIFEAVAAVVTAAGPAGLTLAAVAGRVGLSAPALAQRFRSKQGLLAAFAAREATSVADAFAAARAGDADPVTALVTTLAGMSGAGTTRDGLANNLAFLQMDLTDPELRPHAVAHGRALRAGIAALVADAVQARLLAAGTLPEALAADLWAAYCGAMVTWAIDGTGALRDWIAEHLERILAPHRAYANEATPDDNQGAACG
jgi:AcrR family transcriptional regulator